MPTKADDRRVKNSTKSSRIDQFRKWQGNDLWDVSEKAWDEGAQLAAERQPLRAPATLPNMVGITPQTKRYLKLKSFVYMIGHDARFAILRKALRHPVRHFVNYMRSLFKRRAYLRDGDFFLYGFPDVAAFSNALSDPNVLLIAGFSYCHKPHECPSGRFTTLCARDSSNDVCRQCFIGKALHALPQRGVIALLITTVHYIGEKVLEILQAHPKKRVIFLITACEMTLEMFGDWGNMTGICGIGVRLDGRICNTMRAFELSERGIKPGLTVVLPETQQRILDLIRRWRSDPTLETKLARQRPSAKR